MYKLNSLSLGSSVARARLASNQISSAARNLPTSPDASGIARVAEPVVSLGTAALRARMVDGFDAPTPPPATSADGTTIPGPKDKRPSGDTRSAADIVKDTPVLSKLGRQKDIKFERNRSPHWLG